MIGLGVLPLVATVVAVLSRRLWATDGGRAFAVVTVAAFAAFLFYTGVKGAYLAKTFSILVLERNLIYLTPLAVAATAAVLSRSLATVPSLLGGLGVALLVAVLVVGTARPELLERRPGWGGGKLNAATVGLTPLADDDTARLVAQVLERALIPAEVQRAILDRAAGNPLFAEQFAELYRERGAVDDAAMPETLQGIVAARLDGLSPDEKVRKWRDWLTPNRRRLPLESPASCRSGRPERRRIGAAFRGGAAPGLQVGVGIR